MFHLSKIKIFLIVLLLPFIVLGAYQIYFFNRAYPNLQVGNIDVGGKSRSEIETIIEQESQNRQNQTLSFSVNKSNYISIKMNKDLISYDGKKTADAVIKYGHSGSISEQLQQQIALFKEKKRIAPVYNFDSFTFDTILADAVRPYEKPVIETQLLYTASGPALTPSKPGVEANRDKAIELVKKYFALEAESATIDMQLEPTQPKMTRENSRGILELAKRAVSRPVTLYSSQIPDKTWTLDAPQLYGFLEIKYNEQKQRPELTIADYKVASYSAQFAPLVKKDVKEAKYEAVGNKMIVLEESEDGRELDSEKLTAELSQALFSASQDNRIDLPIKAIKPALAFNTVNQYGIKEVIASGTSHFNGSTPARMHNIETAAQKLNGTLIKPGAVFSMYQAVGNIEKSTGFEDSYIIKNGRTVTGVGGGVCQVSTTLFRAALNAGFTINERHPHSYRVKYYEQDAPAGFDAAIFFPTADLKFTNNTGNYALIQSKMDKQTYELTFNIYGVKDGRTVEISGIENRNQVPPPKEVRIQDASVPRGIIRQTEYAATGSDISFTRTVTKDGKQISKDIFKSHYYPWQAVYLIGTKEN